MAREFVRVVARWWVNDVVQSIRFPPTPLSLIFRWLCCVLAGKKQPTPWEQAVAAIHLLSASRRSEHSRKQYTHAHHSTYVFFVFV
jgi:hypothetical protein